MPAPSVGGHQKKTTSIIYVLVQNTVAVIHSIFQVLDNIKARNIQVSHQAVIEYYIQKDSFALYFTAIYPLQQHHTYQVPSSKVLNLKTPLFSYNPEMKNGIRIAYT